MARRRPSGAPRGRTSNSNNGTTIGLIIGGAVLVLMIIGSMVGSGSGTEESPAADRQDSQQPKANRSTSTGDDTPTVTLHVSKEGETLIVERLVHGSNTYPSTTTEGARETQRALSEASIKNGGVQVICQVLGQELGDVAHLIVWWHFDPKTGRVTQRVGEGATRTLGFKATGGDLAGLIQSSSKALTRIEFEQHKRQTAKRREEGNKSFTQAVRRLRTEIQRVESVIRRGSASTNDPPHALRIHELLVRDHPDLARQQSGELDQMKSRIVQLAKGYVDSRIKRSVDEVLSGGGVQAIRLDLQHLEDRKTAPGMRPHHSQNAASSLKRLRASAARIIPALARGLRRWPDQLRPATAQLTEAHPSIVRLRSEIDTLQRRLDAAR